MVCWFVLCIVAVFLDRLFQGHMGPFLLVIDAFIGVCVGLVYLGFVLTCRLPGRQKFVIRSYAIALFVAPSVIVGHGVAFAPAWMVLIGSLIGGDLENAVLLGLVPIHVTLGVILLLGFLFRMALKILGRGKA